MMRRIVSVILIVVMMASITANLVFADPVVLQPPQRNRVTDIGYYDDAYVSHWYAQINWDPVHFPPEAEERYITFGLNEIEYGTGRKLVDVIQVPLPGNSTGYEVTDFIPEGIKHGTIYEAHARAYYKTTTADGQYTVTSQKSNHVKFLTNLHVSLELIPGTNYIKIKWDDVWDTSGRINYRILISDTKGFTQPPPIPDIIASEIGTEDSPVTVNREERKLEYIYTSALPGREYSIKVVPLPNSDVACADVNEIRPVTIKTDILLKAQRVGYTAEGDVIWRLFWNPIVKGETFTRVDYELYRYVNDELQGTLFRLIPEEDSYEFIVKKDDPNTYSFKIDAKAYPIGQETPVEFRSNNRVMLKEQIPQQPEAPEIVDAFPQADPEPLHYDDFLTSNSASVFWRVPYTGEGKVDYDVTYDIYLVEDIRDVANPPNNYKIASDLTISEANHIRDKLTGEVIGYRYNLMGLKSNSTYYFVIYAKKSFLVESPDTGFMITKPYISKQAVKVIITKPDTGTDRPIAPSVPPFGLASGDESITFDEAQLVLKKKWHALYNKDRNRWEYVTYEEYIDNELLRNDDPDKKLSTVVNYLPGWRVVPHVVRYNDAINAIRMRGNRDGDYITYSDLMQPDIKAFEIPQDPVLVPNIHEDAEDQSFTFKVDGLTHNTTYIVWVTIENQNGNSSDPSDPLVITTPPDIPEIPVTPTVPTDLRGIAGDTFVDLFWTFYLDMDYEIRGGLVDDLSAATITREVSYDEIRRNTFVRIENLEPDTVYYFWIRAISRGSGGQVIESEFSNPLIIKTEPYTPPAPPTGFGIKLNGITESSITYVWNTLPGLTYYLEFADNSEFEDALLFEVAGGEYTVTGLVANRGYYARLYAYDNTTQLRSLPTKTILVYTNKSRSEYDGSFDLTEKLTGTGLIIPAELENGVWVITSLGDHAHLLSERIRGVYGPVVKLDLSEPPERTSQIRLDMGSIVYDTLAELKKELYVVLPWGQFTVRPGTFHTDRYFKQKGQDNNLSISIKTTSPATRYSPSKNMDIKTPVTDINVSYLRTNYTVDELAYPIRVELPISNLSSYIRDQIKAYSFNPTMGWYALTSITDYLSSQIIGELDRPGPIVAAEYGVAPQAGTPSYIRQSMENIQKVYKLSSLEGIDFRPERPITKKAILKLILDVVPTQYTESDMNIKAYRAGLTDSLHEASDTQARRDWAVKMLVSLYKFKTYENAVPTKPSVWARYSDLSQVDARYEDAFKFALENGIVQGNGINQVFPDKIITYGDFIAMLERILRLCGEI